jgi:hypothetical protein
MDFTAGYQTDGLLITILYYMIAMKWPVTDNNMGIGGM